MCLVKETKAESRVSGVLHFREGGTYWGKKGHKEKVTNKKASGYR
jgi:hypothetical protein